MEQIESSALRLINGGKVARAAPSAQSRRYRQRIEAYAERIRRATGVSEIVGILDQALRETRALHDQESTDAVRERATRAERQIEALRAELELMRGLLHEDPLTGALNRRGLDEGFAREAARAERSGACVSFIALDVDHFKRLNDAYGHAAGDHALMHLTLIATRMLRPSDAFARIGGEEFVIVLGETRMEEARLCALRLQAALAAEPLQWDGRGVALTVSAGVAQRKPGEPIDPCLARADAALYAAKRAGRNRVKTAD